MKRGVVGIGIYGNKHPVNFSVLIRTASCLGADFAFTVGHRYQESKASCGHDRHFPIFQFDTVSQLKQCVNGKLIGIEENGRHLDKFSHPEKVTYLLGAEDRGLPEDAQDHCDAIVRLGGEYCLNVSVAGSIVLHDRLEMSGTLW